MLDFPANHVSYQGKNSKWSVVMLCAILLDMSPFPFRDAPSFSSAISCDGFLSERDGNPATISHRIHGGGGYVLIIFPPIFGNLKHIRVAASSQGKIASAERGKDAWANRTRKFSSKWATALLSTSHPGCLILFMVQKSQPTWDVNNLVNNGDICHIIHWWSPDFFHQQ